MDADRARLSGRLGSAALVAVPIAFLGLFFVWPLAAILERSLVVDGRLDVPLDVFVDERTLRVLWFTLWQAVASTALAMLAALPLTWALARFTFRGRRLVEAFVLVPFVLPTIVVATAWLAVLPAGLEQSVWAILLAHAFFNVAVTVLLVGTFWSALDERFWDAASALGAGPVRRLRSVTVPILAPALAAAAGIVFLFCFTSFGVVVVLGGPRFATLEVEIFNQAVRFFDLRTAAVLAVLQLFCVALALAAAGRLERRLGLGLPTRSTPAPRPRGAQRLLVALAVAGTLVALALPLAALVERSLAVGDGWGLGSYRALADETPALLVAPWHAILNSALFASIATLVALAVGLPVAVLAARGRSTIGALAMLPLGASAAMLGFGYLLAFDAPPFALRSSPWIVPLAQALIAIPFVVRTVAPRLRAIDAGLREAAAVLGATPARVRRDVVLPLVGRAVAVAAGLAFAVSVGEFGAALFLSRADWPTLPVAIFRFLGRPGAENVGQAMALSVVLMGVTVAAALAVARATPRGWSR